MLRSKWAVRVDQHRQQSTPFEISIEDVTYDANTRALTFNTNTLAIEEATNAPFRVTAYIVEDSVNTTEQHSYWNEVVGHPLEGRGNIIWDYHHRNVVRTILDNHWGVAGIIPDAPTVGESYDHTFSYTIPEEYRPHRMKIAVMVASFDEVNNLPKEVHDAAQVHLRDLNVKLTNTKDLVALSISIFPNPASNFIEVEYDQLPQQISILNTSGNVVNQFVPSGLSSRINIQSLTPGSYYLVSEIDGQLYGQAFGVVR